MSEESGDKFASLERMRVRQDSIQSTVADYLARHVSGECSGDTASIEGSRALEKFLRNEIPYDKFMELTGGVGLDEEAADYEVTDEDIEEAEDTDESVVRANQAKRVRAYEDLEDDVFNESFTEFCEERPGPSNARGRRSMSICSNVSISSMNPDYVRSWTAVGADDEIDEDRLLGIPLELRNSRVNVPAEPQTDRESVSKNLMGTVGGRKTDKTLDALIGQANLMYAKGQTQDALKMLLEVIRQDPRNPEAYRQVAEIYNEQNQSLKSLQYGLLSAHLDYRTPADEWGRLGELCYKHGKIHESAACYGRAVRLQPTNWTYYERRIEMLEMIGLRPMAMKTRLMAAQLIDHSTAKVDFDWFQAIIKTVAEYYIHNNDEEKAMQALEAFVLRSREFGHDAEAQHKILVGMWMTKNRFEVAAKSIFALCPGITALKEDGTYAIEVTFENAGYTVKPFPPTKVHRFVIGEKLPTVLLARLIVCFIRIGRKDLVPTLVDKLFDRKIDANEEALYLDIARAYQAMDFAPHAQKYVEHILMKPHFEDSPDAWFLYGQLLAGRKRFEEAIRAYERVLDLQPSHVDARINLSTIQQRMGDAEKAFETLKEYDLDAGSSLPDERLLIRQADFLFERKRIDQFVRCVRMLLTPHFYAVYSASIIRRRSAVGAKPGMSVCNGLRSAAILAVRGSAMERYVKRLGAVAAEEERVPSEITAVQLHDYCFKLIEILLEQQRYVDALHVCCYAYLQPTICKEQKTVDTFQNMLFFCSMKAQAWSLAFEYMRWYYTLTLNNSSLIASEERNLRFVRIFNAMNFVFCHSQNVSYHRFIMRALARAPGNTALQMISGNNSLITGAYRHALGEYLRVWKEFPENPLICLLISLTFTHMACKKDISSRHMVALRGLAFMNRYEKLRGPCQESFYNVGRMFHQMNILPMAIHFYQKCLEAEVPRIVVVDNETGTESIGQADRYDLRPLAAHNLALIYEGSGNIHMAYQLMEKYCVV